MKVVRNRRRPPRVALYGPEKIGKSTFGADAEDPIFICTEDGVNNLNVAQYDFGHERVVAESWDEILQALQDVLDDESGFKTLVIDTFNYAVAHACEDVCKKMFGGDWQKFLGWNQGYKATAAHLTQALRLMDKCRDKGMMVILLVHEGLNTIKDPARGEYSAFAGDMNKHLWARVAQWVDITGHAQKEFVVVDNKDASGKPKTGRAYTTGDGKRFIRFSGSAAESAGCRGGYILPDTIELSYAAFADALGTDPTVIPRIKQLWGLLSADKVKETLSWLGVSKVEDAPGHKLRVLLTRLEAKASENNNNDENENGDAHE